jgi:hypothetical protein
MDILLRCNRMSTHPVEVTVDYNGEKARATLPELEIELYDESASHGSIALRYRTQSDIAAAKAMFKQGDLVMATFSKAAPEAIMTTDEAAPAA